MSLDTLIRERLSVLAPEHLSIHDESHAHAGHPGAAGGAGHYRISIVCAQFSQQSKIARHRMVYNLLADLIPQKIHALSIHALSPEEE